MNQSTTSFTDLQPLTFWRVGTYWATAAPNRLQLFEGLGHSLVLPPWAVFGGFLELEGRAGQGIPRQWPGWWGVHWPWCHGVARSCRWEQRGGACTCLKKEVPERWEKKRNREISCDTLKWVKHSHPSMVASGTCKTLLLLLSSAICRHHVYQPQDMSLIRNQFLAVIALCQIDLTYEILNHVGCC